MPFTIEPYRLKGLYRVQPKVFPDDRGYFLEVFKDTAFKESGVEVTVRQVNHSKSQKGVLRGLHYQLDPMAQGKLVYVVAGKIFDVAVDLRRGSPTFGQWAGLELDSDKKEMLYIPGGFAHGFCVVSGIAEVIYFSTNVYSPEHERGLLWNDPAVGIQWPVDTPSVSERDNAFPVLDKADINYRYDGNS